jgi:hypothetical protein
LLSVSMGTRGPHPVGLYIVRYLFETLFSRFSVTRALRKEKYSQAATSAVDRGMYEDV